MRKVFTTVFTIAFLALTVSAMAADKAEVMKAVKAAVDSIAASEVAKAVPVAKITEGTPGTADTSLGALANDFFFIEAKGVNTGLLVVPATFFEDYSSFDVFMKVGRKDVKTTISLQEDQKLFCDECYVFFIPTAVNNKNLSSADFYNAVFKYTVNFDGFDGVTVEYRPHDGNWVTVGSGFTNSCTFSFPDDALELIKVSKGSMVYYFNNVKFGDDLTVPVIDLQVWAVSNVQGTYHVFIENNYVFQGPASEKEIYKVFDNGIKYSVQYEQAGFCSIWHDANKVSSGAYLLADFRNDFYNVTIPTGVTNVEVFNEGWIEKLFVSSNTIKLVKNNTKATIRFQYDGETFEFNFMLDGNTNLFTGITKVIFTGIEGATIQTYTFPIWANLPGTFDNEALVNRPAGTTSMRVVKAGMFYQWDGLDKNDNGPLVLIAPVVKLHVAGINGGEGKLGVSSGGWVYQNVPHAGGPAEFNVFGGKSYFVQFDAPGFYPIKRDAAPYGDDGDYYVYFNEACYQATVPAGVTNVRMKSNNWIVNPAQEGDVITLFKDVLNIRDADMTFVFGGKSYTVNFKLDGTNPFDIFQTDAITITQTVTGGSYNFAATNLPLGTTGVTYEIVQRPNTPGGVCTINAYNLFAFNPQTASTDQSRAGTYVVTAVKDGLLAAVYTIIVD